VFNAFRALVYVSLFVGFVLIYIPSGLLASAGIIRPVSYGLFEVTGAIICASGAFVAVWCIIAFISIGKGTPAPFDPPRRLVVKGPYRFVRNPMYIGAILALSGAAAFYQSAGLFCYAILLLFITHFFILLYEEPVLRKKFGAEYDEYCRRVHRWMPKHL
jgi:protein-S-isoprenylcysteine O-methyltransferase Ste14